MATLTVDTRELTQLSQALEKLTRRQAGAAIRYGLNDAAFDTSRQWQNQMSSTLILRNDWAKKSVRVDKVTTWNISQMRSVTGSVWVKRPGKPHSSSMEDVEEGEVEHKKGRHGVAVPMGAAAGQDGRIPTTQLVKGRYRVGKIRTVKLKHGTYRSDKQVLAATLRVARESGGGFAFLDTGKTKGVFFIPKKVYKNRKDRKAGKKQHAKMIWSYSRPSVRMKPHPTLEPVVRRAHKTLPKFFLANIEKQIQRAFAGLR